MPKRQINRIEWDDRRAAAENARRVLPGLVSGYFDEVRHFLAKPRQPEQLHRMRLASKRLRYTLELFRPCYGPGLKLRLDALKQLQDSLGDVNDAVVTRELLGKTVNREVRKFLRERAAEKAAEFRKHWKEAFDAAGQEQWWTGYLERNARSPKRAAKPSRQTEPRPSAGQTEPRPSGSDPDPFEARRLATGRGRPL